MEKLNGRIQKVSRRSKEQTMDMGNSNRYRRTCYPWLILACTLSIAGCSLPKIKSSLMTGAATVATVGAVSALTPSVIAPAIVGGVTAASVSALVAESSVKSEPIAVTAETVVNKAPDNFFTLLGKLVGMGGWLLGLVFLVPMVLGWILPGPLERKKKGS
jgi:hypothetical protein